MIFEVKGAQMKLALSEGVFAPTIAAKRFLEVLKLKGDEKDKMVWDLGTGTGVFSIYLALNGYSKILATDYYDKALECARGNIRLNNLSKSIEVRKSDVLSDIKEGEQFSLIVTNPSNLPTGIWKDKNDRNEVVDKEVMGGDRGNEVLVTLAKNIDKVMKKGRVVFLQPTYTNIVNTKRLFEEKEFQTQVLYRSAHRLSTWPWNEWKYDKEKLIKTLKDFEEKEGGKHYIVYEDGEPAMVIEIVEAVRS